MGYNPQKIPREHKKYHGYTVRGTTNYPLRDMLQSKAPQKPKPNQPLPFTDDRRSVELKHGRIAMLATMGHLVWG